MYKYDCIEGENHPLFIFESENNYTFVVTFEDYEYTVLDSPVFFKLVTLVNQNEGKSIKDPKVGPTVCEIIIDYLIKNSNVMVLYICDPSDGKHLHRFRKFNAWYYNLDHQTNFELKNYIIEPEDSESYYASIIFDPTVYAQDFLDSTIGLEVEKLNRKKIHYN